MQKRAEREAKEKRIASFNMDKALKLLLKRFGKEDKYEKAVANMDTYFSCQRSKTVYEFYGIANVLDVFGGYVFIIDIDPTRRSAFINSLARRFKKTFDMFEIETYKDCTIAFN